MAVCARMVTYAVLVILVIVVLFGDRRQERGCSCKEGLMSSQSMCEAEARLKRSSDVEACNRSLSAKCGKLPDMRSTLSCYAAGATPECTALNDAIASACPAGENKEGMTPGSCPKFTLYSNSPQCQRKVLIKLPRPT